MIVLPQDLKWIMDERGLDVVGKLPQISLGWTMDDGLRLEKNEVAYQS